MNRIARYGVYGMLVMAMAVLIVAGQHVITMPSVYSSITQMGQRVGNVLPHGYTEQSRITFIGPSENHRFGSFRSGETMGVSLNTRIKAPLTRARIIYEDDGSVHREVRPSAFAGIDLRVPILVMVLYLAALFLVTNISLWKHTKDDFRTVRPGRFIGTLSLSAGVCIVVAWLFWGARVFWTGVDSVMIERSIIQIGEGSSIHIQGNQLLAMGSNQLMMMLIAMVLTALPILIWIDLKLFRRMNASESCGRRPSVLSKLCKHRLIEQHLSEQSIKRIGALCFTLVVMYLWTSPWSSTMTNAFLMSS